MTKEELLKSYYDDYYNLKNKIDNNNKLSFKRIIVTSLIKSGIAIKYSLPYMMSLCILCSFNKIYNDKTLFKDNIKIFSNNIHTITSTGIEDTKKSYDINYSDNKLVYTTKWELDNNYYYKRVETIYDYEINSLCFNSTMFNIINKDFLDDNYKKKDIITYRKKELDINDQIYNNDMFIATCSNIDYDDYIIHKETTLENISNCLWIYISTVILGYNSTNIMDLLYGRKLMRKLNELLYKYKKLSKDELIELKQILELKKNNIELLDNKVKKIGEYHE